LNDTVEGVNRAGLVQLQDAVGEAETPTTNVNRSPQSPGEAGNRVGLVQCRRHVELEGGVGDGDIAAVIINGAARAGRAVDPQSTMTTRQVALEVGIRDGQARTGRVVNGATQAAVARCRICTIAKKLGLSDDEAAGSVVDATAPRIAP